MNRLLALATVLLVAGSAPADLGPPPGSKRVPAQHKITTDKEFPDYRFFKVLAGTATEVKLNPKTPADVTGTGLGPMRSGRFVAVPRDAAKKFDGEKELLAAVGKGTVEGAIWAKDWFGGEAEVKVAETRKVIVTEHKLVKVDAKEGIVFARDRDAKDPKVPPPECDEDAVTSPTAYAPKGGTLVAGLAGTFAVVFGGLWLARRGRRELA